MNCESARAVITRWTNGQRDQPVRNMINAARGHVEGCPQQGCVQATIRLDHQRLRLPNKSHKAVREGAP